MKQRVNEFDFYDYIILDGYERIKTLRSFLNNDFSLRHLLYIPELNGFNYEKLSSEVPDILDCFSFSKLPIVIFPNHLLKSISNIFTIQGILFDGQFKQTQQFFQ